ncbi:hypothetical protein QBC43DRAFT_371979 [Cladorrhinum sp. PSN259]|nr:hypothetical protein QBC43DRAFT_371979 [Cladorrhinum sp. PSN259]
MEPAYARTARLYTAPSKRRGKGKEGGRSLHQSVCQKEGDERRRARGRQMTREGGREWARGEDLGKTDGKPTQSAGWYGVRNVGEETQKRQTREYASGKHLQESRMPSRGNKVRDKDADCSQIRRDATGGKSKKSNEGWNNPHVIETTSSSLNGSFRGPSHRSLPPVGYFGEALPFSCLCLFSSVVITQPALVPSSTRWPHVLCPTAGIGQYYFGEQWRQGATQTKLAWCGRLNGHRESVIRQAKVENGATLHTSPTCSKRL